MSTSTSTTTTISFALSVPTTLVPVIAEAFVATYGPTQNYSATLPDGTDNPITPEMFTQSCVVAYVANVVEAYAANQAATQASAAALAAAQQQTALIT